MKFVRRVAFWATGGGHLKYYINWPEKCSTPQTPSNRSFLTPKTGHFGGGPENPHFLDFFADFLQNYQKSKVSRFLLNAWSLWTRLCCWYMHHTWVLSSSVNDPRLRSLSPRHFYAVFPCHCVYHVPPSTLTRKTTSDPITPHFSFTRSSHSNACLLRATADTRSCPTGGCTPTYFIFDKEVCPWSSITFHALYDPNRASLPFHSHFAFSHMRRAPGGETQALSRYGLIPNGFPLPIADSSLLRHWLSHHLRSLGRP